MFLLVIVLSYLLGVASTIIVLLYIYSRYLCNTDVETYTSLSHEQYPTCVPIAEDERAKNSAVDSVNYFAQFLYQELKDTSRLRRYILHKLNTEFKELKNSRAGKLFLQNIQIQDFSLGAGFPYFSDIKLEHSERDDRGLIKEFVAIFDTVYKEGFCVTVNVTLVFGRKCLLIIKIKRIEGQLRLNFKREPYTHWTLVFKQEPQIDFELRRAIRRKQTWPNYKIRYQPFFSMSKQTDYFDVKTSDGKNLIPGVYDVLIKNCDRLIIPNMLENRPVFVTLILNEKSWQDILFEKRELWPTKEIEFVRVRKIVLKEIQFMNNTEVILDEIEPKPNEIKDDDDLMLAIEQQNAIILKIQGQEFKTIKQAYRLLRVKSSQPVDSQTIITTNENTGDKIKILIALPHLNITRLSKSSTTPTDNSIDNELNISNTEINSVKDELNESSHATLRHRGTPSTAVKFQKTAESIAMMTTKDDGKQTVDEGKSDVSTVKINQKQPQKNSDITFSIVNTDLLQQFQVKQTAYKKAQMSIEFNEKFELKVGESERYLNVCLWCKPPNDDVKTQKKLILIGYTSIPLSQIVLDAHMSFKRETQLTLNFFPPYPKLLNIKKFAEFVQHKGYDDNLAHGFITINIIHRPQIEQNLDITQKREQYTTTELVLNDLCAKLKEKEKNVQANPIDSIKTNSETPKSANEHTFEDHTFSISTVCDFCSKKIWMKAGRKCATCSMNIHKKCEASCITQIKCPFIRMTPKIQTKTPSDDDLKNMTSSNEQEVNNTTIKPTENDDIIDSSLTNKNVSELIPTRLLTSNEVHSTSKMSTAAAYFSAVESRVYNKLTHKFSRTNDNQTHLNPINKPSNVSKSNENISNIQSPSLSQNRLQNEKKLIDSRNDSSESLSTMAPQQSQSKLASFSNSAYTKFRDLKQKRAPLSASLLRKNNGQRITETSKIATTPTEDIAVSDVKDIIMKCLSDNSSDFKNLEHLLHERSVDHTTLYAKAKEFGPELFPELNLNQRKQKFESEISRMQHEIDLQCQTRDEMIRDSANVTDENEKRKIESKVTNIDEKIQALAAMVILFFSGLQYCLEQLNLNGQKTHETEQENSDTRSSFENSSGIEGDEEEEEEEENLDEKREKYLKDSMKSK
ncbi:unnamed protein product [Didymodactylos carnosus]|uniref:Phorbol-ester/DAG-type domain-containing protein n=1 Tax=Didymodactylos carnosus TaxID=1234261 RepID=A0A813W0B0_9BILA|nr:unnamed protein product [Didymodactylos carnosus]CAF3635734.1 unnamed protein product [Didymodactylos carnosus]